VQEPSRECLTLEAGGRVARVDARVPEVVLLGPDGDPLLPPLRPELPEAVRAQWPRLIRAVARGRVRGRAGPAERVEIVAFAPGGPALRWSVELDAEGRGLAAELAFERRDAAPADAALCPLSLPWSGPTETRVLWAARGAVRESLGFGALPGGAPFLLGFTTAHHGWTRCESRRGTLALVSEGAPAAARTQRSDRAWLGLGGSRAALLEEWARRAGREAEAPLPRRSGVAVPAELAASELAHGFAAELREAPLAELAAREGVRAYRERLAALREALPGGALLVADGPPLASAGLADGLRVAAETPALLEHAVGNQRLWLAALALDELTGAAPALRTALSLAGLATGVVALGAPVLAARGPVRRWLRRALPPLGRDAVALDAQTLRVRLLGERVAVLLVNAGRARRPLGLRLADAGVAGPCHVFDFWADAELGLVEECVPPRLVAAGGCRLLALTPPAPRPQVIGTTLHVGMGTLEVAALRPAPDGVDVVLRHPGRHAGSVWIALPDEPRPRSVRVRFTDSAVLRVAAGRST
jgi:hypothetical protein